MARADLFRPPRQPTPEPVEAPRPPDLVRPPTEPVPTFIESPIDVARTAAETIGGAAQTAGGFIGDIAAGVGEAKDRFLRAAPDLFPEEARGFRPPQPGATARQEAAFGEAAGAVAEVVFTPYTVASGEVIDQFLRSNPVMSDRFAQGLTEAGLDPNDRVSSPRLRFEVGQRVVDEHLSVLWDTYLRGGQDESNAAVVAMTGLGLIKFAQSFGPQLTRQGLRIIQNAPRLAQMIGLRRTPGVAELTARTQVGAEVGVPRPVSETALADRLAARSAAQPNNLKAANDAISQRQFAIRAASREAELRPSAGANEALATARGEAFEPGTGAAIRRFISEEGGQAEVGAVTGVNLARAIVNKFRGQGKNVTPELEAELTRVAQKMESGEPLTAAEQKVASGIRQEAAHGQFGVPFEKQRTGLSTSTFAGIDAKTLTKTIQDTTSYRSIQGFGAAVRSGEAQRSGAPQGLIDHFLKGEVEMGLRTRGVSEDQIARMLGREAGAPRAAAPTATAPKVAPKGEATGRLFERLGDEGAAGGVGGVRAPTARAPSAEPPTAQGRMPGDVGRVGQPMLKTELETVKGSAAKQALLTPGIGKGEAATTAVAKPSFPGTAAPKAAEPGGAGVGPLTSRILGGKQPPPGEGPITKRLAAEAQEGARPSLTDVLRPPKAKQTRLGEGSLGRRIKAEADLRAQGQQSLLEGGEFKPAPPPEGPVGTKPPAEPKTSFLNLLRDETGMAEQLIGDKKVAFQDWLHIPLDLLSASRAIKSSFDLSAYRQAAPLIAAHPKVTAAASQLMIRSILRGGPELARSFQTEIRSGPLAAVMRKAGLEFTEFETEARGFAGIAAKEEAFPTTEAVQAIPGIRESSRAFTVFLNKMKYDLFKNFHNDLVKSGRYKNDSLGFENELRVRARQLNKGTGRGTIITEGQAAKLVKIATRREASAQEAETVRAVLSVPLNFAFWAPRLVMSRVQGPIEFLRAAKEGAPAARDVAAKELVGWVSSGLISLKFSEFIGQKIGEQFPDLKDQIGVEWDLRSPNAYKIRVGDRYYDFWGGAQQIARFATQFATGERKIIRTGEIAPTGRAETALRFARSKLSPGIPTTAVNITTGETFIGEPVTPESTLADLFAPLALEQAWETYREPGEWGIIGLLLDIPEFLGVGVTTIRREPPPGPIRGDRATSTDGGPSPIRGPKPTEAPGLFRLPDFLDRPAPPPPPLR